MGPLYRVEDMGMTPLLSQNAFYPSLKTESGIFVKGIEYISYVFSYFNPIRKEILVHEQSKSLHGHGTSKKQYSLSYKETNVNSQDTEIMKVNNNKLSSFHDEETGEMIELTSRTFQSIIGLLGLVLIMILLFLVCLFL